jgi:anti-anti-sigma factor
MTDRGIGNGGGGIPTPLIDLHPRRLRSVADRPPRSPGRGDLSAVAVLTSRTYRITLGARGHGGFEQEGPIGVFVAEVKGCPGEGYVAVRVAGDVDTGTRAALTDALERALAVGSPSILVDLTGVRFFAAAGVHCVERAVGALEARGGAAHVVCPQPGAAWRVVSLLGLQQQWLVHQDLDAAVAGCTADQ